MTAKAPKPARTVLVVDDFDDNRAMYAEYLQSAGYRVIEARDGAQAIDRARRLRPDVVVMDLSLPVLDGWEATRRLKADPKTRSIPVIALTGHALADHSRGAREAGCDVFLTKPCLPKTLLDTLSSMLAANEPDARKAPTTKESEECRPSAAGRAPSGRKTAQGPRS